MSSQWEFKDYVWTYERLREANCTIDMIVASRIEWWAQVKEVVLQDIQPWLDGGWEPMTTIGPECWDTEKITIRSGWRTGEGFRPIAFRVPMRRRKV